MGKYYFQLRILRLTLDLVLFIDEIYLPVFADPSLVLPALVHLVYSSDERLQSTASDACVGVLKYHSQNAEVICLLLDCLRYFAFPFIVVSLMFSKFKMFILL